ncbi:MAG TPA: acetyl-CoA C-acyltransferase [Solirubrobacteraceae bacterium]|jgi:acetyl-CoA C-acetyltransferase|nr:acetyl-CoA C-acyltransferase [Solirubrobacteraceae bacterium]
MPDAVIVDAVRTPIGRAVKGSLKTVRADDLAAIPLRALMERNPQVPSESIVDVMMGCGFCEGEQGYNIGRNASLLAGIDYHVPGTTVNRFCASSLQTARMAFHAIRAGEGDTYIAAGVEAVSRAGGGAQFEFNHLLDGSEGSICNVYIPMGLTAENVAEERGVSRQAQDEWAVVSQTRAVASQESGHFDSEIVPVTVPAHKDTDKEGNEIDVPETVVTKDDGPRPGTTLEKLSELKPAFRPDGTVTAGNACPLNDGAAALLIMSEQRAKELGLTPKVKILASTVVAIRPEVMGLGPIPAIQQLLKNTGRTIADVDVVEINEAFAAQIVPCMDELGIDAEKLNPFGGAIALGHPFGMTGARIMTTLINDLQTRDETYGIESMCVAGGMGMAMLVERLS